MGFLHQFVRCQVSGVSLSMFSLYTKGPTRYSARQEYVAKGTILILTNLNDE